MQFTLTIKVDIMPPKVTPKPTEQRLITSVFAKFPTTTSQDMTTTNRKWVIARQLALMCCRDLEPFYIVEKPGFIRFLIQNNVIHAGDDLPKRTTVSRTALDSVYDETAAKVKELLEKSPLTVSATTDLWTDNYKRRSYMTVTVHFCLPDFTMQSMVLRTVVFPESHTGVNICQELSKVMASFGLVEKKVVYITDQGSNIIKACRLAGCERFGCVAHAMHNLISVDGIRKHIAVQEIILKVKAILKTFTFKTSLLENEAAEMVNEQVITEVESALSHADDEEHVTMSIDDDEMEDIGPCTSNIGAVRLNQHTEAARKNVVTLKKDCPTRWNCLLMMLESLQNNKEVIERCLTRLRAFDKMLSNREWDIIDNLLQFLKVFKSATEVLSGAKYPTISLVLLFRAEIVAALTDLPSDCVEIKSMKCSMRLALDRRLPVTDLNVVAAMLDPSQRALNSVQSYLIEQDKTAVDLLKAALLKYVGEEETTSRETAQGQASLQLNDQAPSWKKAKLDLLGKHATSESSVQREIQQFRCLNISTDDILTWWSMQSDTYPRLSHLARIILSIPATSAPSERIFSVAGLAVTAKRSSLAPSSVDKIIFIHENAHFVAD